MYLSFLYFLSMKYLYIKYIKSLLLSMLMMIYELLAYFIKFTDKINLN